MLVSIDVGLRMTTVPIEMGQFALYTSVLGYLFCGFDLLIQSACTPCAMCPAVPNIHPVH